MVDIPGTEMSVLVDQHPMLMGTYKIDAVGDSTEVTNVRIGIVDLTTDVLTLAHGTIVHKTVQRKILKHVVTVEEMIHMKDMTLHHIITLGKVINID